MMRAYYQVLSNKGSAGVDGMGVKELYAHLTQNRAQIESSIRGGRYQPQAILGVEIPKSNGKTRLLGVPTVTDRMLQQAVGQVLAAKFEMEFEDYSYGFRPNKNAQKAVLKAQEYINSGYQHIVDIDLIPSTRDDEVDHCILLQLLYRKVKCPLTLRLIRKWLRAPILINGKLTKRRKGVPQGSPLSPLLSNIMLNELDKEMERQGLKYVRYADDFSIYCKSLTVARKIGNNIYLFLKEKLKLPINREKSGIRKPVTFKILGYGFVPTYVKGEKGQYQLVVSETNEVSSSNTIENNYLYEIKELGKTERETENHHPQNHSYDLRRTHPKTQRGIARLDKLLPIGKYTSQAKGTRRVVTKPSKVLYMA